MVRAPFVLFPPLRKARVSWVARLGLVTLVTLASTGCVRVQAHQRGTLAKRAMTNDRDPGEVRFGQHALGSREGADGGTGQPGGGCGCN